ncbi:MAG: N-6 DNA methylase [Chloroflexi bacterium]|nr:N-6 DNA methylase [Chloroflexota bacterium]MCY4246026.1 N-6 DNA methylase [Chloroflexota bacterium]
MSAIRDYLSEIQAEYKTSMAGEHAYRPALKSLLESTDGSLQAVNDAARTAIGMPDFVVLRQPGNVPIGIVEAKDISNQLSRTEKSQQIKRYQAHGNLILTNYLEFRWYVNSEMIDTVRIARVKNGKLNRVSAAYADLLDMLRRFARQTTQSVNSARELAERLARSAQFIAHFIEKDLKSGAPSTNLQNQMAAFQRTLLPGLDIPRFADMYAQTLAYGLFASRVNFPGDPASFSLRGAAEDIPQTNPFLRDLFYHSRFDIGARLTWMAEGLVEILRHTDMDGILADFGQRTGQTDPVVHFYETFLAAYNPSLRETRGVYFTPEPVVKYIVRSVDHILKTRFDRPRGLADENALILDPAAGTGTFLYFVIETIKEAFAGQQGLWKSYVSERLLPRIFGFELLMAPYTVAHMNLSLQLKEAGYAFKAGERLGIYLTNALEEAKEAPELPFAEFITAEANEAVAIKRDKPIMVVLGNPPYSYASQNKGQWISDLVRDYYFVDGKPLGERNPKALQDDYVKFIRFAQWRIEQTGEGVLAFVTNNSYLDAPTFRGMRKSLLNSFSEIYVLNLHGDSRKSEQTPDGNKDENVFDIIQGVAIIILIRKQENSIGPKCIHYSDLWGLRKEKYEYLSRYEIEATEWECVSPLSPNYFFKPFNLTNFIDYRHMCAAPQIFKVQSMGITIQKKLVSFVNDRPDSIHYRVFDKRFIDYDIGIIQRARYEIMQHLHGVENLALVTLRRPRIPLVGNFFVTDDLTDKSVISSKDNANVFPLYLYPSKQQELTDADEFPLSHKGRRPNLSKAFVSEIEAKLGLRFVTEGSAFATPHPPAPSPTRREGELDMSELDSGDESPLPLYGGGGLGVGEDTWFGPEDIFYYAYATFHSPTYRERYAEFLKIDFPRLPLTSDLGLFAALVRLGAELVGLHLMKSSKLSNFITTFDVEGDNEVARGFPKYNEAEGCVFINKTQYFGGVAAEIWDFHIGGYRVAEKWLKDRRGRKLSYDDLTHYQKIIVALSETRRVMSAIDAAIPSFPIG